MKYGEFRQLVKNYPVFSSKLFDHLTENVPLLRRQVTDWVKKGAIIQLKRGLYSLKDEDRQTGLSRYFLAGQIYSPSYIGLETALSYYGIIPEAVHAVTSITTKKTQVFKNHFGQFIYHHIKQENYGDYLKQQDEFGYTFYIASIEQAIVEFLYFRLRGIKQFDDDVFEKSFRFQNIETVNIQKLQVIAERFKKKKLDRAITLLIKTIEAL